MHLHKSIFRLLEYLFLLKPYTSFYRDNNTAV